MAESQDNIITRGLRGKIGDILVFRRRGNKTFVYASPRMDGIIPSEKQTAHRKRFKEAAAYAKKAAQDPELRKIYEKKAKEKGVGIYHIALADYMKNPPSSE